MALIFGIIVLIYPSLGVVYLIILLSFGLMFVGIRAISNAGIPTLSVGLRVLGAIAGVVVIILALLVLLIPSFGALT